MIGLFRTLLILALIYYGVRFLLRYVLPIFSPAKKDFMDSGRQQGGNKKRKKDDLGDYIDYEEVDDPTE